MFHVVLALLFFLIPVQAKNPAKSAVGKTACNARELRGQDCRLALKEYKIRLLSETIARDDGTWHTVDPMPLKGAGILWEKISFEIQAGRPILQFWLWDAGTGEASIQALHWYTADARHGALKILAEGVVRRRRLKLPEEIAPDVSPSLTVKPTEKRKAVYLYDNWEKHALKARKDGKIDWILGAQTRVLDPEATLATTADLKPADKKAGPNAERNAEQIEGKPSEKGH